MFRLQFVKSIFVWE